MADTLHVKTMGHGQDLVLLHGWAMHGGIWPDAMLSQLAETYRLHIVDLPGHGLSKAGNADFTVSQITATLEQSLLSLLKGKAIFIGWSLGGLIAANLVLRNPGCVEKLVLIATSLRFTKAHDWLHAVDEKVLTLFAENLMDDYRTMLSRFLALQFSGDEYARQGLRELKQKVFERDVPEVKILEQGLEVLLTADFRQQASYIDCPVQLLGGEHDTLTPAASLVQISEIIPHARVSIIKGASHAPFISHTEAFLKDLTGFIND
ncbi:MAG: pimeloyl-ACP methyl ester esterase BioH [Gammaproteobacteria bacterium]|nr:pimeloyl-ACP methyl ester esterase BioH [Gammaproteobacteria bacterium]